MNLIRRRYLPVTGKERNVELSTPRAAFRNRAESASERAGVRCVDGMGVEVQDGSRRRGSAGIRDGGCNVRRVYEVHLFGMKRVAFAELDRNARPASDPLFPERASEMRLTHISADASSYATTVSVHLHKHVVGRALGAGESEEKRRWTEKDHTFTCCVPCASLRMDGWMDTDGGERRHVQHTQISGDMMILYECSLSLTISSPKACP